MRTWRKGIRAPAPQPTSTTLDAGPRSGTAAAIRSRFCQRISICHIGCLVGAGTTFLPTNSSDSIGILHHTLMAACRGNTTRLLQSFVGDPQRPLHRSRVTKAFGLRLVVLCAAEWCWCRLLRGGGRCSGRGPLGWCMGCCSIALGVAARTRTLQVSAIARISRTG
jgi:hypothetical protein